MKFEIGQKVFFPFWGVGTVINLRADTCFVRFEVPLVFFEIFKFALFPLPVSCPLCKKRFFPFNPTKIYCSTECRKQDQYSRFSFFDYIPVSDINTDLNKPISEFIKECEAFE